MLTSRYRNLLVILLAGGCCACLKPAKTPFPVDPEVTFASHEVRSGLAVDRTRDGGQAQVVAPSWFRRPGAPTFVLRVGKETRAAFWVSGSDRVVVRKGSGDASSAGSVEGAWEHGAIRLTLRTADGTVFRTDTLARAVPGGGPGALSRTAQTVLDVRGTYRTTLRDAAGEPAGWLRVQVGPYQRAPRIYDGVLPETIDDGLAGAAVLALRAEITWIEEHALDVYRGAGGDRLQRSIDMSR
jgi:hypothetical protein